MRDISNTTYAICLAGVLSISLGESRAFGEQGEITTFFGGGVGDGGAPTTASLIDPRGVFADSLGNVYIADTGHHRIRKVDGTGIISTVAGSGIEGLSGDGGPAVAASLAAPVAVVSDDSGNLYIADTENHRIRKVSASGIISTFAGGGTELGDGGPATDALLDSPAGLFLRGRDTLYIADTGQHRIRMVDSTGVITTLAGDGVASFLGDDGPSTAARLNTPAGLFGDADGNLYIADRGNSRIRKIDAAGTIQTVAGSGVPSFTGDDGPATDARLNNPEAVFVDSSGTLFFSDRINHRIRRVDVSGTITTVAGTGTRAFAGDEGFAVEAALDNPRGLFVDAEGVLLIADSDNNRIRRVDADGIVTTSAGSGPTRLTEAPFLGDGLLAANADLNRPFGLYLDGGGSLFVADTDNQRVRKVDGATGIASTIAGNGEAGYEGDSLAAVATSLNAPGAVISDADGNVFVVDTDNHRIRKVDASGIITTVAGTGGAGFSGDSERATIARLNSPEHIFLDTSGNLYIADTGNNRVRKIDTKTGVISTLAGSGGIGAVAAGFSGDDGPATDARLNAPSGLFVDGFGNVYIADEGNARVRKIDPFGTITSIVGAGGGFDGDGEPATDARLNGLRSIFLDAAGSLFIADQGNDRVRKVDASGIITTVAGTGSAGLSGDGGPATEASLDGPSAVFVDTDGDLYIVDRENSRVRVVEGIAAATHLEVGTFTFPTEGVPPRLEGSWPRNGAINIDPRALERDGITAIFDKPIDMDAILAIVTGSLGNWTPSWKESETRLRLRPTGDVSFGTEYRVNLFQVADQEGNAAEDIVILFTTQASQEVPEGNIATAAGDGTPGFAGEDEPASEARLFSPSDVFVDDEGNLFIADRDNHRVRKVDTEGNITTIAGNGLRGFSGEGGSANAASLDSPTGVFVDADGNVYIVDRDNGRIRKVSPDGTIQTVAGNGTRGFSGDGASATDASLDGPAGIFVDAAGNIYIVDRRNKRIRKVDAETGSISTVAGNGFGGFTDDGGSATDAGLDDPTAVTVDSEGNLYIVDGGRVRKVDGETGQIDTVAGGAAADAPLGDGGPATEARLTAQDVFVGDDGSLYIADSGRIRHVGPDGTIETVAGTGELQGPIGDGGPAVVASMSSAGIILDKLGNLFVADQANHRVRKVDWPS